MRAIYDSLHDKIRFEASRTEESFILIRSVSEKTLKLLESPPWELCSNKKFPPDLLGNKNAAIILRIPKEKSNERVEVLIPGKAKAFVCSETVTTSNLINSLI